MPFNAPDEITAPQGSSASGQLVKDKYLESHGLGLNAWTAAQNYMSQLSHKDYDLDWTATELESTEKPSITIHDPDAPDLETVDSDITDFTATVPVMDSINIDNTSVPPDTTGDAPSASFNWVEPQYASDLLSEMTTDLREQLSTGGTGLGAAVEEAIYNRAKARVNEEYSEERTQINSTFAARGFSMPSGMQMAAERRLALQRDRRLDEVNNTIIVEQAELALKNKQFTITSAIQLEQIRHAYWSDYQARCLEAAVKTVELASFIYKTKVDAYIGKLEAMVKRAEVDIARANAYIAKYRGAVEVFRAQVEKYRAEIERALGLAEINAKINGQRVALYEADIKRYGSEVAGIVGTYEAQVRELAARAELSMKEADAQLQVTLAEYGLDNESLKAIASISAQMAAAALNSFNASATIGSSEQRSDRRGFNNSNSYDENKMLES